MRIPLLAALALLAASCASPTPEHPVVAKSVHPPLPWPDTSIPLPVYDPPPLPEGPSEEAPDIEDLLPPIPDPGAPLEADFEPESEPLPSPPEDGRIVPADRVVIVFTPLEEPEDLAVAPTAFEEPEGTADDWIPEDDGAELVEIVEVYYDEETPTVAQDDGTPVLVVDGYNSWARGCFPVVVGSSRHDPCAIPAGRACVTDEAYDPCWNPRFDPRWGSWQAWWVDRRILKDGRRGDPRHEKEREEGSGPERIDDPPPHGGDRSEPRTPDPGPPSVLPERRRAVDHAPAVRDIPGRSPGTPIDRGGANGLLDDDSPPPWRARPARPDPTPFGPAVAEGENPAPWTRGRAAAPEAATTDPDADDDGPGARTRLRSHAGDGDRAEPRRERVRGGERGEVAEERRNGGRPGNAEERPAFRGRTDRDDGPAAAPASSPAPAEEREDRRSRGRDREDDGPRSRPEPREEPKPEPRRDRDDGGGGRIRGEGGGGHGKRDDDGHRGRPK